MCVCVCVVDGKTITVNDKLESFTSKAGNKFENGVSKSDTVDSSSDTENRNVVEVRVFSDHNEREYRGSLNVKGEEEANFYGVKCEAETSQALMEDKSSSIVFVEQKRSSECSISCLCLSGRARWCFNNKVVLPSVWNENVKCWEKYCDERKMCIRDRSLLLILLPGKSLRR